VWNGVQQGSVLGLIHFLVCINDLDRVISSNTIKLADNTQTHRILDINQDGLQLQQDLENVSEWAVKWQMEFNVGLMWSSIVH